MSVSVALDGVDEQRWGRMLAASRAHCRQTSRLRARNFYYGMKLVPEPKRSAMDALYAWMRRADDLADEAGGAEKKVIALRRFQQHTHRIIDPGLDDPAVLDENPLWPAVRDMVLRYEIPREYLDDMIDGQLLDQQRMRCATFGDLYPYCYKVASVVGLCCVEIWGYEGGAETRQLAEWRGVAFQLTNILRDVLEDAQRDRVYLPAEDFDAYELHPVMFTLGKSEDVVPGLRRMIDRAMDYYERSAPLDERVHRDGRPCLWAMTAIYRRLLERIARDPAAVLSGKRVRLAAPAKAWIALRATWLRGAGR